LWLAKQCTCSCSCGPLKEYFCFPDGLSPQCVAYNPAVVMATPVSLNTPIITHPQPVHTHYHTSTAYSTTATASETASLQAHTHGDFQPHSIPWFGAVQGWALVPPEASINEYDDPAAIMVLTEGGQLMVHDLNTFQPVPLSLPFQELQAVTDACMCASPVQLGPAGHIVMSTKLHCVTLQRLRVRPWILCFEFCSLL